MKPNRRVKFLRGQPLHATGGRNQKRTKPDTKSQKMERKIHRVKRKGNKPLLIWWAVSGISTAELSSSKTFRGLVEFPAPSPLTSIIELDSWWGSSLVSCPPAKSGWPSASWIDMCMTARLYDEYLPSIYIFSN